MGRGAASDYRPPQWPLSLWTFTPPHSRNSSLPLVGTWNKAKPPPISLSKSQVEEIDRAIGLVLASPRRWPASDLDTRKFVLRRFPYAVIYHERKSVVRILAIAHGHRQPGYWKDRVLTVLPAVRERPVCPHIYPDHSLGGWYSSPDGLLYLGVIAGPPCLNQHPPLLADVD